MKDYPVCCQTMECGLPAEFKVASRWSDGATNELKTYALCCQKCLKQWFDYAKDKQRSCRLTSGETLEKPEVYDRVNRLKHRPDLES